MPFGGSVFGLSPLCFSLLSSLSLSCSLIGCVRFVLITNATGDTSKRIGMRTTSNADGLFFFYLFLITERIRKTKKNKWWQCVEAAFKRALRLLALSLGAKKEKRKEFIFSERCGGERNHQIDITAQNSFSLALSSRPQQRGRETRASFNFF